MINRHRPPSPLLILIISPFLLLSFLTTLARRSTAVAQCLPDQSSALLQLKKDFSTNSSTTKLDSWKFRTDCCDSWEGVTCNPRSRGRVTALDLSNRFISGTVGMSLFNLTSLTSLNLAYNLFNQSLPSSGFEKLANLTHLNLSNAGFYGQIPSGISRLTKLVSLDLSTFFVNEIPSTSLELHDPNLRTLIANLSNLRELYLDGINISSDGFEWSRAVSNSATGLQALSLVRCSLSGPIHPSLSRLRSLLKLRLDQNKLKSNVPEFFGNFSSLSVLRLGSCEFTGVFPKSIFLLRNLTLLDVSGNRNLSGNLPDFPKDSTLEGLVLSSTNFSGTLPRSMGNLKSLTTLLLSGCKFSGVIPSSFSNLTQLVRLDLSFNNFSGELPSMVRWKMISDVDLSGNRLNGSITSSFGDGVLRNLTGINLSNNSLSGTIPGSLFSLPSLQNLLLSQNQFSGRLEKFSSLSTTLSNVDLSNNKLQGLIPNSVFRLSGLKILNLASNNFGGTVRLDSLRSLTHLANLDLSNNILSVIDGDDNSSLSSFPNISTLRLVSCNVSKLPGFLRHQYGISTLDLSMNRISGSIPKWLWNIGTHSWNYLNLSFNMFTSMEVPLANLSTSSMILDLHDNLLQGPIPLPPLNTIVLDYSNNKFTSSIPSNFAAYLPFTVFLSLSNNSLTGAIPPSICGAGYLQVLDLSNNKLSGFIPSCLSDGSNSLGILNLRGNQLYGPLPRNFSESCALRTINLNGNRLSGQLPRSLANCTMLEVLDLGNNRIVDTFPYWLGGISSLRVLVLRSNGFYGDIGPPAGKQGDNYTFQMLQIIDLSSNNFTGSLRSECFKNLKAMMTNSAFNRWTVDYRYLELSASSYYQNSVTVTYKGLDFTLVKILTIFTSIDFSNNSFEGDIPRQIGELNSLLLLNLSDNSLTGGIPPQLGNLSQLESLDLSSNHLSGEIPLQLTSLTFLSSLNLSYNNLSGRIPLVNQFSTFSDASFLGNEGLCGIPLSKQCNSASVVPPAEPSNFSRDPNWQFIFTGLGFGGGLAMMVGPFMIWTKGKKWYYRHVDRLLWAIFPWRLCVICGDGKVRIENVVDDLVDTEEEDRKFCVFCTKLEFDKGRVMIHHVKCSCRRSEEES